MLPFRKRPHILPLILFVQMGTLAVQEAMGMKVDREAVATLVLPQLWAMCIGPSACLEFGLTLETAYSQTPSAQC
jgi:hypothetical protein